MEMNDSLYDQTDYAPYPVMPPGAGRLNVASTTQYNVNSQPLPATKISHLPNAGYHPKNAAPTLVNEPKFEILNSNDSMVLQRKLIEY